jgi:hypothetical protein
VLQRGGFALHAQARRSARSARRRPRRGRARARAGAAELNGLAVEFVHADAFPFLRDLMSRGERPDLAIVDPHKLIGSRGAFEIGLAKYLTSKRWRSKWCEREVWWRASRARACSRRTSSSACCSRPPAAPDAA